ncbi:MAG: cytochrome c [Anaerolineae bacterium]
MKRIAVSLIIASIALSLLVLWSNPLHVIAQPPTPQELPAQKPSALRGRGIYDARCTRCHGLQGAGDGAMAADLPAPPPSFLDVVHMRQVTPAGYFDIITNGNLEALMPPWGGELSAQERWDVLAYVWSLGTSPERVDAGQQTYARACAECHGDSGDKVEAVNLGELAGMALRSQADLATSVRDSHTDTGWQDTLTDDERWAVVDYVRTFTYEPGFTAVKKATGEGVIEGQVIDGTAGAQADMAGLAITLFPFVGQTTLDPITTTTTTDGRFRFESLPTEADRRYGLQTQYLGVSYFHPELIGLSENPSASATVHVYETTTDDTAIDVQRNHVIIEFANNRLQVAELYIFRNSGDRTYVGDGSTLRFRLPEGAGSVRFDDARMNQSTRLDAAGVVDTLPVTPGSRQVLMSYSLPYSGRSITFEKAIEYSTESLNVLVADVGVEVDAGPMVAGEPVSTQSDVRFLNFTQQGASAGDQLILKLTNLPEGGSAASAGVPVDRSGSLRWFGLGFVLLALAFIMGYPALRPRLVDEDFLDEDTAGVVLRRQRQMLLEELVDLDDAYAAGELAESSYRDTRSEVKADLIDIMDQLRSLESTAAGHE